MAAAVGCGYTSGSLASGLRRKCDDDRKGFRVSCVAVSDPYKTLIVRPGASESEVKKAFRQIAKKYHPDVCRGSNCDIQFHQINQAYDVLMRNLKGEAISMYEEEEVDEAMRGMNDQDWELWEEWMGWEVLGIRPLIPSSVVLRRSPT